ncbi:MAG: class B sortase [Lachnospiraceae bacterium]|nr:class B sortase [Lachnospiraceae bacterium]
MKGSGPFRFWYRMVVLIFAGASVALFVRAAELRRSAAFYERAAGAQGRELWDRERRTTLATKEDCALAQQDSQEGIVTWIQIADTPVNYPVMRGADNQYYLDHLPDGSKNALGSLFLDCRCSADSPHWIIYGHNGIGGKMFGSLRHYVSQDYFAKHPVLTVAVAGEWYACPIFSVRTVEADSDAYTLDFADEDALRDYVEQAAEQSLYPISVSSERAERVLTLSTCTGWGSQRLMIQAVFPVDF